MKKQPQITEQTRQNLIDAFCRLHIEKPIEKISVQQITNLAGYNRSTFYQYFSDIYQLRDALVEDVLAYVRQLHTQEEKETRSITERFCLLFETKGPYLRALLGEYSTMHFMEALKKELVPDFLYEMDDQTAPYWQEYHIATCISILRLWINRGYDLTPEEMSQLLQKMYLRSSR